MKPTIWVSILGAGLFAAALPAQTLEFWYVAPLADMVRDFGAANVRDVNTDGYRGVQITASNVGTFNRVAPANVRRTYEVMQPGQTARNWINRIAQINSNQTDHQYYLIDDRKGFTNGSGRFSVYRNTFVWPAAFRNPPVGNARAWCRIGLSEVAATRWGAAGWGYWERVILHETNHCQFVTGSTRWPTTLITYGGDQIHSSDEIIGDQELPYEEGLGNFFGSANNSPSGMQDAVTFFSRTNERYYIESHSVLAGSTDMRNAPHRVEVLPVPPEENLPAGAGYAKWHYTWRNVPGFYLLFSESTSEAYHLFFRRFANNDPDQATTMIISAAAALSPNRIQHTLTYTANRLALQLEAWAATPAGQAAKTAGAATSSMFPYALLDILTHFGMTDAEFQRENRANNPDRDPRAYTAYFARRAAVRALVQPYLEAGPNIRIEQAIQEAHRYFQAADTILTP